MGVVQGPHTHHHLCRYRLVDILTDQKAKSRSTKKMISSLKQVLAASTNNSISINRQPKISLRFLKIYEKLIPILQRSIMEYFEPKGLISIYSQISKIEKILKKL